MQNNNTTPPIIAIIGASYAGLTLANILHMHNIPYVIFDSKSLPFTYVMGGTTFNVPSYKKLIVKKLELDTTNTSNDCNTEEEEDQCSGLLSLHRQVQEEGASDGNANGNSKDDREIRNDTIIPCMHIGEVEQRW